METQKGGGGGVDAALPAQFRRGCPSDVPLRFGTGHGERGDKGERERSRRTGGGGEAMVNSLSARDAPPPPAFFSSLAIY